MTQPFELFSVVLLAGGKGTRMESSVPKQYLSLKGKPLALYSFECFLSLIEVQEIVVVCDPSYENLFRECYKKWKSAIKVRFALPGELRQDSTWNGIQELEGDPLVCVHDAARPIIKADQVRLVVKAASKYGAAVLGVPMKSTIKVCDAFQQVVSTLDRSTLWEIQTPQVIRLNLLKQGFDFAKENFLSVTDDVSLVELLGKPVKIVEGSFHNIKVTTPEDFLLASQLIEKYVHV